MSQTASRIHDHEVVVYGSSITVATNGTKFLEEWGVETVARRDTVKQKLIMHNWKDSTINDIYDLNDYTKPWRYVYNLFHRIDLHEQLQNRAKT
ncbi:unnamed protein product [Adineta ricciae]|uniref:Uncharacterized protein n=1 Tax=Adineta ricciae TaxID=249248 RepID=A0A815P7Z3_ADIRI|nr:unnamed protein product [Adineta ricciae]CAF1641438.1 unnamed protein product [Adineta ricciae]